MRDKPVKRRFPGSGAGRFGTIMYSEISPYRLVSSPTRLSVSFIRRPVSSIFRFVS
jgi:hypothetical protein